MYNESFCGHMSKAVPLALSRGEEESEELEMNFTYISEFPIQYLSKKQKKPVSLSSLLTCKVMLFSTPKSVLKRHVHKKFIIP